MVDQEETFTVDSDQITVEIEVETQYGSSIQRQTIITSPGDEVTVKITEE